MKRKLQAVIGDMTRRFKSQKGVTTVEYAIMLALVALAVAAASPNIKSAVVSTFNQVSTAITTVSAP